MPDTYLPASKRRIFGGEKRRHPVAQTLRDIAHGMNATANQATLRKAAELIDRMTNAEAQPGAVLRELVALKDLQERLLSLHEMGHGTDYGDFHKRNREAWAEASAFAASGQCRSDGRCQYAIDHGAEGMGHCPQGKCCMLLPEPAYKHIDGDTNDADLLWAEIHHLRAALQGPAGFATWQDAATDERIRRIKVGAALRDLLEIDDARIATGAFTPNAEAQRRIDAARAALTKALPVPEPQLAASGSVPPLSTVCPKARWEAAQGSMDAKFRSAAPAVGAGAAELPEPACWMLTSDLNAAETGCRGRVWFVDPINTSWEPLYRRAAPLGAVAVDAAPEPQRARKIGGSYQADGVIVSEFLTTAGERRVVFEFDSPKGMLHIFNEAQIERVAVDAAPQQPNPQEILVDSVGAPVGLSDAANPGSWRSIDSAPRDGSSFLVPEDSGYTHAFWQDGYWWWHAGHSADNDYAVGPEPKGWLPAPPAEAQPDSDSFHSS